MGNQLVLGIVKSQPMALIDSSKIFLQPNEKVPFSWLPLAGASSYKQSIYNSEDTSLVYEKITDKTTSKVSLEQGEYLWDVDASANGFAYQEWKFAKINGKYIRLSVIDRNASIYRIHSITDLHVDPFKPEYNYRIIS